MSGLLGRQVLVRVGRVELSSYVAMLYVGCVAGTIAGAAVAGAEGLGQVRFVLATVVLIVPALVGSRVWFLLLNRLPLRDAGRERDEGGSALFGGLVLSAACSPLVLAVARLPLLAYWDAASVTMLLGLAVTRVGCTMHGCCAGRPTTSRLGVRMPDDRGRWERRVPVQPIEAVWGLVGLVVVLLARPDDGHAGTVFAAVVGGYAATRLVLEPMRAVSAAERVRRANQRFAVALLAAAAVLLAVVLSR